MREGAFGGADIFGEPAWDILLDLFIAAQDGKQVSVTAACAAAAVPVTTALRWIGQLEKLALIERRADPTDRRRMLLTITDAAMNRMTDYFAQVIAENGD